MRARIVPLAILAALATGCAGDAPTAVAPGDATFSRGGAPELVSRPISGRCENTFQIIPLKLGPNGEPLLFSTPLRGTCEIAHLGRSAVAIDQLVNFTTTPISLTSPSIVYTAANGDQVRGTYAGSITSNDGAGNITFTVTETITGGTGRFAGARGTLTLTGGASQSTLTSFFSLDGTIAY